ncbi:MAG: ATP-binding protein [Bacteroidia bacterium]|nr:ATP-binding protein [Bacteroidia bacterium]HQV00094.1 ATP-binding protein [Bacteroidia bacterium]
MAQATQNHIVNHIAIVGPESTGKSVMAKQLAQIYNGIYVEEYARMYLEQLDRNYNEQDLLLIAKQQLLLEEEALSIYKNNSNKLQPFIFYDTTLLVIKIWSEFKYGQCNAWILQMLKKRKYNLQLLMDIDLPWEFDPIREHPDKRQILLERYQAELKKPHANYHTVNGLEKERLQNAVAIINQQIELGVLINNG